MNKTITRPSSAYRVIFSSRKPWMKPGCWPPAEKAICRWKPARTCPARPRPAPYPPAAAGTAHSPNLRRFLESGQFRLLYRRFCLDSEIKISGRGSGTPYPLDKSIQSGGVVCKTIKSVSRQQSKFCPTRFFSPIS